MKIIYERKFTLRSYKIFWIIYFIISGLFFWYLAYDDINNATLRFTTEKSLRLYADHPTYVNDFIDTENFRIAFLFLHPNHFGPFLIQWIIGNDLLVVYFFNISIMVASIYFIDTIRTVNRKRFFLLTAINPITFISLFSINKENVAFLSMIIFICYIYKNRIWYLVLSLIIGFVAKKELALYYLLSYTILTYSRMWLKQKALLYFTILFLLSGVGIVISNIFGSISAYADESQLVVDSGKSGGTILILNDFQNKYGYIFTFWPKLMINLFGSFLTRSNQLLNFEDIYNDIVVWGQSFLFSVLMPLLLFENKNKSLVKQKLYFLLIFSFIIFAYIPVIQNRYFYPSYLLLTILLSDNAYSDKKDYTTC